MSTSLRLSRVGSIVVALMLAACGAGPEEGGSSATQVAAKVNNEEISVHQVNAMLARAGSLSAEQAKQAGASVLERLIDQELLVQQARDLRLDRDPNVMQAVEAARREVLARAYLDRVSSQSTRPTEDEIREFYSSNPALFAQRKIYNLQELNIVLPEARFDELRKEVGRSGGLQDVVRWLEAQKIPFRASAGVKPAEQLPLESLPSLAAMKDGQTALLRSPSGALMVHVLGSREHPMDEEVARPFIEQFLATRKRADLARAEVRRLRENGEIVYMGEFAATAPEPAAPSKQQVAPDQSVLSPLPGEPDDNGAVRAVVERGAGGLR